jgi:hypothetical protein
VTQPVYALDFTFSFRGVEGYLTGLVDNSTNQIPATVFVTDSPSGQGEREYYYWATYTNGFSVADGEIVAANTGMLFRSVPQSAWPDYAGTYGGQPRANDGYGFDLALSDPGNNVIISGFASAGYFFSNVASLDAVSNGMLTYNVTAVPGPVPILGVFAALRCSHTLRKRCRL